jgi:hypothetical protein
MNQGARAKRARDVGEQRGRSRLRATQTREGRSLCDRAGALEDIPRRPRSARRASRLARVRRGRGRGVPAVRNLGARVRAREVRRLRLVPSRCVLVSATRLLSLLRRPSHGRLRRAPRRSRRARGPVAPVGPDRPISAARPHDVRSRAHHPRVARAHRRLVLAAPPRAPARPSWRAQGWRDCRRSALQLRARRKRALPHVVPRRRYSFPVGSMPVFHPTPRPATRTSRWLPPQSAAVSSASSQRGGAAAAQRHVEESAQLWCALAGASVQGMAATGPRRGRYLVRMRGARADVDAFVTGPAPTSTASTSRRPRASPRTIVRVSSAWRATSRGRLSPPIDSRALTTAAWNCSSSALGATARPRSCSRLTSSSIVAALTSRVSIERVLEHLGLALDAPEFHPARPPPQTELSFGDEPAVF